MSEPFSFLLLRIKNLREQIIDKSAPILAVDHKNLSLKEAIQLHAKLYEYLRDHQRFQGV